MPVQIFSESCGGGEIAVMMEDIHKWLFCAYGYVNHFVEFAEGDVPASWRLGRFMQVNYG